LYGTGRGWGWAAFVLPHLEQDNLYAQFNVAQPVQNFTAIQMPLKVFLCPSDPNTQSLFTLTDPFGTPLVVAAPSSYAACCGGDESDTAAPVGSGVFYRNSRTRIADITDGTSQTILIGERACADTRGIWAGAVSGAVVARGPNNINPGTSTEPAPCLVLAHCHLINTRGDADGGLDDFGSRHPGGANFVFADGSVHFLRSVPSDSADGSYTADSLVIQALATRAGGEVVPGDWVP
jgi:prepilin-type processing-associated H-X9-DG protein